MIVIVVISLVGCGDKISAEVKNTMKEFESLCDEYCDIVKKITSGDTSVKLDDLTSLSTKLNEVKQKAEKLKTKDLNDEEKEYIKEVSERSMTKVQTALESLQSLR